MAPSCADAHTFVFPAPSGAEFIIGVCRYCGTQSAPRSNSGDGADSIPIGRRQLTPSGYAKLPDSPRSKLRGLKQR